MQIHMEPDKGLLPPKKKYFGMLNRSRENQVSSHKLVCRFFDALVMPALTYGCEVWGAEISSMGPFQHEESGKAAHIIEGPQLRFLNRISCVQKSTPGSHVRGEFGRYHVTFLILSRIMEYWIRLEELGDERLV
jgi:hypothetical protein